ncbi:Uma2 family endonuclease [Ammoniphilus sp. 3BR4]|uniref:Uma2 family endonuclease n=1 Tax=Ammoniphilus sp. 3BR4 TaxID=3158265 RepID=UPI003465DC86
MSLPNIEPNKQYTVKDIAEWEERWELIEGVPYLSASPSRLHQTVSRRFLTALENYMSAKPCEVFAAPFDVYLSENIEEDYDHHKNAVQPDLFIVCNPSKIHDRGVKGAPDWIAEIISPTTAKLDRLKKFNLYEKFGVTEFWLISPYEQSIEIFVLGDNKKYYRKGVYGPDDQVTLHQFEDFFLDVSDLFRGFPLS